MKKSERDELLLMVGGLVAESDTHDYCRGFQDALKKVEKLIDEQFRKPQLCMSDSGALAVAVSFLNRKGYEVVDQRYRGFILAIDPTDGDWVFVEPRLVGEDERVDYYADRGLFEDAVRDWVVEGDARIRCDVLSMVQISPASMMIQHHIDALR